MKKNNGSEAATEKNARPRKRKALKWFGILMIPIAGYLTYYQLWYKSPRVDSNIFKLDKTLAAHRSNIWAVDFTPDGKWVASGSVDSSVKIWDKESGAVLLNLKQPSGVTYLAISPDGNFLVTAAYDEKLRLWQLPEGHFVKEFKGHKGTIWSVDYSPDGKTIASSGEDNTIKLWDVESGQLLQTFLAHTLNVWDVKFSPDGNRLASGSYDKTVKIWDVKSGKLLHTLTDHTEAVVSLAFSPDGKILASTSDDKSIKLWDTGNWKLLQNLTTPEHTQAAEFSPDGKQLLTGGRDKPMVGEFLQNIFGESKFNKGVSMRLWDVASGKLLQTFSQHGDDVNDVSWSPDGKCIASGSADHTVGLWRLAK